MVRGLIVGVLVLGSWVPVQAGDLLRRDLAAASQSCVHIDLEAMNASPALRELRQDLFGPTLLAHLDQLPSELRFLRKIELRSVTVVNEPSSKSVVLLRGKLSEDALVQFLSSEPEYVVVNHRGVAVHHWSSDTENWKQRLSFVSRSKEEKRAVGPQSLYLSVAEDGTIAISNSLKSLAGWIDRQQGMGAVLSQATFDGLASRSLPTAAIRYHRLQQDSATATAPAPRPEDIVIAGSDRVESRVVLHAPHPAMAETIVAAMRPEAILNMIQQMKGQVDQPEDTSPQQGKSSVGVTDDKRREGRLAVGVGISGQDEDLAQAIQLIGKCLKQKVEGQRILIDFRGHVQAKYSEKVTDDTHEHAFNLMILSDEEAAKRVARKTNDALPRR